MTPGAFWVISARARVSDETVACVVTSPVPMSSSSAVRTSLAVSTSTVELTALQHRIRRMDARPAADSHATLAHWMGPLDANGAGFVHGGTVMKLCDEAAGLAAVKHCRRRVVTASMDRMTFMVPIHVGELVSFQATINAVWHTSMEVGVRVDTENPRTGERRHSNSAYLTMAAVDKQGNPMPVPPLLAGTEEQRRRESEAQLRRSNRLAEREQIQASR